MKKLVLALTGIVLLTNCAKEETTAPPINPVSQYLNLPSIPFQYSATDFPNHVINDAGVITADNEPLNNPITDEGATLGRVLFYEKALSENRTVACASCHQQNYSFSDPNVLSDGFEGGKTGRHSMGIANARFYDNGRFFWDERAATLEEQVLMPIQDPVEMGLSLDTAVARITALPYYPTLFKNAFGSEEVTSEKMSLALAQFVRSINSFNSRYDEGRAQVTNANRPFPNFTNQENTGKNVFFNPQLGGCAVCHGTEAFIAPGPRNNGLDATTIDEGVGGATGNPNQDAVFKVPSLRTIASRPPYMHDGRFATLEEVVEHYSTGVQDHPNLSPVLRNPDGSVKLANLSTNDKAALVAFLKTLDDTELTTHEKYSDPFK